MTVIFTARLETDLLEFTNEYDDATNINWSNDATAQALAGTSGAMAITVPDATDRYCAKTISPADTSGEVRLRVYFDPNSIPMDDEDQLRFAGVRTNVPGQVFLVAYFKSAGNCYFLLKVYVNGGSTDIYSSNIVSDAPHYVEVHVWKSSGDGVADGGGTMYVDGNLDSSNSTLDNYTEFSNVGYIWAGERFSVGTPGSGTVYIDEIVVNNDGSLIGPLATVKTITDTSLGTVLKPTISASLSTPEVSTSIDRTTISSSLSILDSSVVVESISIIAALTSGSTCWGQSTGVLETNIRTFAGNWSGTGSVEGSGDSEQLVMNEGEYMISEVVITGAQTVTLLQNNYAAGDTVTLQYRHGATQAACEAASWNDYTVSFESLGYVQVRVAA